MQQRVDGSEPSTCPIRRIVILHLNLARLCTGKEIGESASHEELSEQILYYNYHGKGISNSHRSLQEAVQFAGLCDALYNLPDTLKSYSSNNQPQSTTQQKDPTLEVQLEKSFLVFVPLEDNTSGLKGSEDDNPTIVAVAQVARSSLPNANWQGGSPLAIRASIQKWHKMFCLLRGGGIHQRLCNNVESNPLDPSRSNHQCLYPGMDQQFEGQKTLRRLRQALLRSPEPDPDLELELQTLMDDLSKFKESLPITLLREDLKFHYDAFIGDLTFIAGRKGGAARCLVDLLPSPVPLNDGSHARKWASKNPLPHVTFHLGQAIRTLTTEHCNSLLAVSTFYHGEQLYHHGAASTDAKLLMGYFAFYNYKIKQQRQSQRTYETSSPPRRISRVMVSLSDKVSVASVLDDEIEGNTNSVNKQDVGKFLETPPLAMLSASEQKTTTVRGPQGESVWAPLICYNLSKGDDDQEDQVRSMMVHAILYEFKHFSFLLFVRQSNELNESEQLQDDSPISSTFSKEDEVSIGTLLGRVSKTISTALRTDICPSAFEKTPHECHKAPGHVIFVDRATNQMKLFPRWFDNTAGPLKPTSKNGFLGGFRIPSAVVHNNATGTMQDNREHEISTWAEEGLDCRHWLASRLSFDAIVAVDDLMIEVDRWRKKQQSTNGGLGRSYELLTTISSGWVYAFADQQERELYMLLDSRGYVTMSDVQSAITQARAAMVTDFAMTN